jgi:hypothetical protein
MTAAPLNGNEPDFPGVLPCMDISRVLTIGLLGAALCASGCASESPSRASDVTATPTATATPPPETITVKGKQGRMFRCPSTARSEIDAAKDRVRHARKGIDPLKRSIQRIKREFPGGAAPPAIATHVNLLVARHNARVRRLNVAVDAHNRLLRSRCDPA